MPAVADPSTAVQPPPSQTRDRPPTPPAAVLFDVGMTLVHMDGAVLAAALAAAGIEGVDGDTAAAAVQAAFPNVHLPIPAGRDATDRIGLSWAALLDTPAAATCAALARALGDPDLYRFLDPDAHDVLRDLRRQGVRLGVVSNSDGTLDEELAGWGLAEYFEVALDSTAVGVAKPDPAIFRQALDVMGLDGADCWYVGDNVVNDVLGAHAAGFAEVVLYDRFGLHAHIPGVLRITHLSELADLAAASRKA